MGQCGFRMELLLLYCVVLATGILTIAYVIQTDSEFFRGEKQNMNNLKAAKVVTDTTYSAKLNNVEKTRLGFALQPEYQIVPKSWQTILYDANSLIPKPLIYGKPKRKQVVLYNKPDWAGPSGFTFCPNDKNKNPKYNCDFVDLKVAHNISQSYDAIFVYGPFVGNKPIHLPFEEDFNPGYNKQEKKEKTSKTTPEKAPKLIYFTLECPNPKFSFVMRADAKYITGSRGYLASYWRGSDLYIPYLRYERLKQSLPRQRDRNYALGRSKMAAMVVSNCRPNNNRMGLVKELQKYIQVDIFGACATKPCRGNCFEEIKKHYKFYLAFENSNCRDYITEKFGTNAHGNDLLPIVFGAHPSDYKAIAPPNSYIHIEDFESIQKLGEYLHLLDQNDTLYNSYFTWKDQFYFTSFSNERIMCDICAFLHADDLDKKILPNLNDIKYRSTADSNINYKMLPYFNGEDKYELVDFKWDGTDERLCLPRNEWYWNK